MILDSNIQILTGWCAASAEAERNVFPGLVHLMRTQPETISTWETLLRQLGASRLIRQVSRSHRPTRQTRPPLDISQLTYSDSHVFWQGQKIGRVQTNYKATLPHETQARIAYEVFFDRFTAFLTQTYKVVVLSQSDFHLELFMPVDQEAEITQMWQTFVDYMFSAPVLQQSFASLVNTIKLTDRGFSALSVPIVSQDQAVFLSAFYLANLNSLKNGDKKRESEIAQFQQELIDANEKDAARIEKQIAKLEKELAVRHQRYDPFYGQVEALKTQFPDKMEQVEMVASKQFRGRAGTQIAKSGSKIGKCVNDMTEMLALEEAAMYRLSPLVTAQPPISHARPGGDSNTKLCYACGRVLERGMPVYSANKFIFESPSQRLQSAAGQTQPKICGTCAAISFISPIKIGSGRLVVRMRPQNDPLSPGANGQRFPYKADEQLRMFMMGEMNIIAGKYVILQASEMMGTNPVADQLGGEQYAVYKVGISFLPEVFRQFQIEAVINDADVPLPGRHLAMMHGLSQVFSLNRRRWDNKGQFAAFGRAIRQVQKDDLAFAIYELATSGILSIGHGLGIEKACALEDLRKEHVEWLEMSKVDLAQQYRDIAAMTALVYPFCVEINNRLRGDASKQRIEVRKIIDRTDDPYELMYTIAQLFKGKEDADYDLRSVRVYLNRNSDTYFSYDQLIALLDEPALSKPDKRESKYENSIPLTLDDLANAYTFLYGGRYKTDKEQREFAYKLKLSLAARFPQLYEKKDSDKE